MDVKQFAFLARQRTAEVQPRELFCGMPKRGLAFILANAMFWQPLWAQAAEGIVVSAPGTTLDQAGNGVPIINIAAPNGSGLSHNQFSDYNVGSNGVILNNAIDRTQQTQLGGIIIGNPNFHGNAASTILNEVNGGSPSQLRGYTEVAGQSARVIVANPYGVTCNGCGFINTPQVTLSTGKPVLDAQGALSGYQVDGGSVSLEGAGLNASNVGRFDIITRSAKLNAQLHAQELNVITGRNDVDAQTLKATPRAGSAGDAPALAIDSSALGGMYAGAIRLVGTETGVGVRLAGDLIASGGDIQLDANGHLNLAKTSASGALTAKATSLDAQGPVYAGREVQISTAGALVNRNSIAAADAVRLNAAGTLDNRGVIEAGLTSDGSRNAQGDVTLTAQQLDNHGQTIVASRDLQITASTRLNNQGGTLSAANNSQVSAATLDNSQQGRLLSGNQQQLKAEQLLNSQGGQLRAGTQLTVDASHLDNRSGELASQGDASLHLGSLDNTSGSLNASQALSIDASTALNNQAGTLSAGRQLNLSTAALDNRQQGRIDSRGSLDARVGALDQRGGGQLHAAQALNLDLQHGTLNNDDGGLITTPGQLTLQQLGAVSNRRGEISSQQAFVLAAQQLDNQAGRLLSSADLSLRIAGQLDNSAGLISATALQVQAGELFNREQGKLQARGGLLAQVSGSLDNRNGVLQADSNVSLNLGKLDNRGGQLSALNNLELHSRALDNSAGGHIRSGAELLLDLNRGLWNNAGGMLSAPGTLVLRNLGEVDNQQGEISSQHAFALHAERLGNQAGKLLSEQALDVRVGQLLDNHAGLISANGLDLQAGQLNNQDGTVKARDGLTLKVQEQLLNQRGNLSARTLAIDSASLDNRAGEISSVDRLQVRSTGLNNAGGRLFSGAALSLALNHGHLDNQVGLINAPGQLLLEQLASVDNRGGEVSSAQAFVVQADSLLNQGGKVLGEQGLTLRIAQALNNAKGRIAAANLELSARELDNSAGTLSAGKRLDLQLAGQLHNQYGELRAGDAHLQLAGLDNQHGLIQAERELRVVDRASSDNRQGKLLGGQHLALDSQALDNRAGELVSDASLTAHIAGQLLNHSGLVGAGSLMLLNADHFDNQAKGRIAGKGAVELQGRLLENRGGSLAASGAAQLTLATLNNQAGQVSAEQSLKINASQLLDNSQKGDLQAKGPLQVSTTRLNNREQGRLISADRLDVQAASVDNAEGGRIASGKALVMKTAALEQQGGGQLSSDGSLNLDLEHGRLGNHGGLIHAQGPLRFEHLADVDNRQGEISSTQAFELNARTLDNSGGDVLSEQQLSLLIAQTLHNLKGTIGAAGLKVDAAQLDNSGGSLGSDTDLTLQIKGELLNHEGELTSAGQTRVQAASLDNRSGSLTGEGLTQVQLSGKLDNQKGLLGAGERLEVQATSLDNRGGRLLSEGQLQANVSGATDNREQGKVLAQGLLELTLGSLDNRQGQVSGRGPLTLRTAQLDNQAGLVHADQYLQLFVAALDNRSGVLRSKAALDYHGDHLRNDAGLLTADGALLLVADQVDNAKGRIASRGDVQATLGELRQQGGTLVAEGGLGLNAKQLDNRAGGSVASNKGLKLNVNEVDNRGGQLSGLERLDVEATLLNNSDGGKLLAGTALALKVEQLLNQNKGRLFAQHSRIEAGHVDNRGGTLAAGQSLAIDLVSRSLPLLDAALDNQGGTVNSEGTLSLDVANLNNAKGKLSSAGDLRLDSRAALHNRAGLIETDALLTLNSASLDNRDAGVIRSNGDIHLRTGAFDNSQGGQLVSQQRLQLTAGQVTNQAKGGIAGKVVEADLQGLDQQGGELFGEERLSLDLNHGLLDNQRGLIRSPGVLLLKNLDGVANQQGEISSDQAFDLVARRLDTSGGKLLSQQGLSLRIDEQLNVLKGLISARALDLRAGSLDNRDGLLSSVDDSTLRIDGELRNQGGSVFAGRDLLLHAGSVDNAKGKLSTTRNLTATLGSLDNQAGQVMAQGQLTLNADSVLNGQQGLLAATKALKLEVDDFDNRDGEVSGKDTVSLTGQRLDNREGGLLLADGELRLALHNTLNQGVLQGKAGVQLNGNGVQSRLDNSGGRVLSRQQVQLELDGEVLNSKGLISSEGTLKLNAGSLDNRAGRLDSAGKLSLDSAGALLNQGGVLVSDGAIDLNSASLDNSHGGMLSAKGALQIRTGALDNQQKGRILSNDQLTLTSALLNNSNAGRIASSLLLKASVTGLEQQGGELFSASSLELDLNRGQLNNQGGLINSPGQLLLRNLNGVANQGGEISSAEAFSLLAQELNNDNGKLLSNQGLNLGIGQQLSNRDGQIAAAGLSVDAGSLNNRNGMLTSRSTLGLAVGGLLDNSGNGLISAATTLNASTGTLNNQGGLLFAKQSLNLSGTTLDNSAKGLLNSAGSLTVNARQLLNGAEGEVSANDELILNVDSLSQQGGRLLAERGLQVNLQSGGGDLNNQQGLIQAKGPLRINNLRDLNNRQGEIASREHFTLSGNTLDNTGGKLISSETLAVNGATLVNQGGLMSGWKGLGIGGGSLDNSQGGTLSSRDGYLAVALDGRLDNNDSGALVAQGRIDLNAGALDNSAGVIASGAGQRLDVQGGSLDNQRKGEITSGAELAVIASNLNNQGGSLLAQGPLSLELLSSLNNNQGTVLSKAALTVSGKAAVLNQGGQLLSQSGLSLTGASLDNRNKGTVAAAEVLTLTTQGALLNDADGLIYSQNAAVNIDARRLSNQAGAIQGQSSLNLNIGEDVDNRGGQLLAQTGNVVLKAASLDNRAGVLASVKGALEAQVAGLLRNDQGGTIQAQQLKLIALGGLSNLGGRLAAQAGQATLETSRFANQGGGLYASGLVKVDATELDNRAGGQIGAQRLDFGLRGALYNAGGIIESDSSLALRAASFDNQGGQLRAQGRDGKTELLITGQLDNRNGTLEVANHDLGLQAASFLNQGGKLLHGGDGDFAISMANVSGAGGDIVTRGGLSLNAASWSNSSTIQAGRLSINVGEFVQTASGQLLASQSFSGSGGNWVNNGLIASDGSFALNLAGSYSGSGRASSLGDLTLNAAALSLAAAGSIAGGATTTLGGSGTLASLNNLGRISSAQGLNITAGQVNNYGSLGSSQRLQIVSNGLRNERGLLFSGQDMALWSNELVNWYGDVYSLGRLDVARDAAGNWAGLFDNVSGTVQSNGDMLLRASELKNRKELFQPESVLVSSSIGLRDTSARSGHMVLKERYESKVGIDTPSANIYTGSHLTIVGRNLENSASVISAQGNLTANLENFSNQGASLGNYSVFKSFDVPYLKEKTFAGFWAEVTQYNAANDAGYTLAYNNNPKLGPIGTLPHYDAAWNESRITATLGMGGTAQRNYIFRMGSQSNSTFNYSLSFLNVAPSYNPSVHTPLPGRVQGANFYDPRVITEAGQVGAANAVVQAGGTVLINATRNLSNSVIREGQPVSLPGGHGFDASGPKAAATTIINIHSQLPPDLAQQQVNPLSLPGFSIPSGQNGLFRLSSNSGQNSAQRPGSTPAPSWTLGTSRIDLAQREQGLPTLSGRSAELGDLASLSGSSRELVQGSREGGGNGVGASAVQVANVGNASTDGSLPGHAGGMPVMTRTTPVQVDNAQIELPGASLVPREPLVLAQPGAALSERDGAGAIVTPGTPPQPPQPAATLAQPAAVAATPAPVNPLSIPRVQGLPDTGARSQPHKYLIETNPLLTDLQSFMGSDYLLGNLGYDPDQSWKRLGDGYFEQRMVQEAVIARTGQRFIDGQTNSEALYKHLMDNAIASKDKLDLSVGVTLTAQQVAALTHDIVWLEAHEVNGEEVLVPVLYLAQANNRLAPNGALIAGNDVSLIAGDSLSNVGTLKATNNLSASAGKNLINGGLIEAGNRLDLLAGDSIFNAAGGILKGRDVSVNAVLGDVINERSVTSHEFGGSRRDYVDVAARIEAGNNLSIGAGRDVMNTGGVLNAGRDLEINAGRDLVLNATEQVDSDNWGSRYQKESITQFGGSVEAGRDISLVAGRDFAAIASDIEAKRNIAVNAGHDLTLASAANEEHFYSKTKKVTRQEDHVHQVATTFKAGGNIDLSAENDLTLIASRVEAGNEAYLVAGNDLSLLSAEDRDYSLYDKKSKGSWGSKVTKRDESTRVTHVGSEITTGGDLTLVSSGDQRYQAAKLDSGGDLTLDSGGDIYFQGVKDLIQESHEKSKSSLAWFSMKGKGSTDETFRQSELNAKGDLVIKAAGAIHADVRQVNQESVSESIDAMVKADPSLGWLKELEAQGGVDWRQVQEIHTRFKYENSGLGAGAQMVMAILLAAVLGPAGLGLAGAQLAGAAALANTALNSAISNKGDLGQVFKDTLSKDSLTSAAIAAITAGIAEEYFGGIAKTKIVDGKSVIDLGSLEGIGRFGAQQVAIGATSGAVGKALGRDADVRAILQSAVFNTLAATAFSTVGDANLRTGSPEKIALHALVGGFVAQAAGGDFATGAIAAGANELLANQLRRIATQMDPVNRDALMTIASQLVGVVTAAARDEGDGKRLQDGSWIASTATQYNNLNHSDMKDFVEDMNVCGNDTGCQDNLWVANQHKKLSDEDYARALKTGGVVSARHQQLDIEAGLVALEQLNCTTTACQGYKDLLVERAVTSLQTLAEVTGSWEPFLQLIGELPGRKLVTERVLGVSEGAMKSPGVRAAVERAREIQTARKVESEALEAAKTAGASTIVGGKTCVYSCVVDGVTRYVGITDDIAKRGAAHLSKKGIVIEQIPGLKNLSRADARAVEQVLIEHHGRLSKGDGTLLNLINSISKTKNPTKYERALVRGSEILKKVGYQGF